MVASVEKLLYLHCGSSEASARPFLVNLDVSVTEARLQACQTTVPKGFVASTLLCPPCPSRTILNNHMDLLAKHEQEMRNGADPKCRTALAAESEGQDQINDHTNLGVTNSWSMQNRGEEEAVGSVGRLPHCSAFSVRVRN